MARKPPSLATCEPGDVVEVELDGQALAVTLGMQAMRGNWYARPVAGGELFVLPRDCKFLRRISGRERYSARLAGDGAVDPLLDRR